MSAAQITLVDGIASAGITANDRGLAFGDGLFETIAVINDTVLNWSRHYARLRRGCDRLHIPQPDSAQLVSEARQVTAGQDRSVVKIIITRGPGGQGYTPPSTPAPVRIVMRRPWPAEYADKAAAGVVTGVAAHRLSKNPDLAGLKHLNRLDQVLASMEMQAAGWDEALMLTDDACVVEATRSNVFAVFADTLATPSLSNCGVSGVMRETILARAPALGLRIEEADLSVDDLRRADELFLCNAIAGIWPVSSLVTDRRCAFPIGPVTNRLRADLAAAALLP